MQTKARHDVNRVNVYWNISDFVESALPRFWNHAPITLTLRYTDEAFLVKATWDSWIEMHSDVYTHVCMVCCVSMYMNIEKIYLHMHAKNSKQKACPKTVLMALYRHQVICRKCFFEMHLTGYTIVSNLENIFFVLKNVWNLTNI